MLYIVVALKSEAQAFVDTFKLQKSKLGNHLFFNHKDFKLIVSGVGSHNSRQATQTLLNHFDIEHNDIFINFGVCGAKHPIGSFVLAQTLCYQEQCYPLPPTNTQEDCTLVTLTCLDEGCNTQGVYETVDMESFGFYDAVVHNPAIKQFYIFKVVSDNFQPHTLTKEGVKQLLFQKITPLFEFLRQT